MNISNVLRRARCIVEAARNCTEDPKALLQLEMIQLHTEGYAEPGYTDPDSGIIALGNWNPTFWPYGQKGETEYKDETLSRVSNLFESLGIELEWEDEWIACGECGKLVRTSPNSYGWTRSYADIYGECLCEACVLEDPETYLDSIEGNDHEAVTIDIDLEEHGYVKANNNEDTWRGDSYQHGLYGGQDDNPRAIAKTLRSWGIGRFLFTIDGVGQFDMDFSVWVHESEKHLLRGRPEGKTDIDPATALERALKSASVQMSQLEGNGIKYAKCKDDGTATVRIVSPQEFIDGVGR